MLRLGGMLAAAALSLGLVGSALAQERPDPRNWRELNPEDTLYIDTVHGRIVVEMYPEIAPNHVERIKTLSRLGFYNGVLFHRVIEGFMAQTGDPLGTGEGASNLPDLSPEFSFRRTQAMPFVQAAAQSDGPLGFYKALPIQTQPDTQLAINARGVLSNALHCRGVVSMARSSAVNSANSQFFLMRGARSSLNQTYTVWGRVVWGQEAVDAISVGEPPANPDRMLAVRVAADLPPEERAPIYVLRTDGPDFRELIERTRRDRRADFSVCDVQVPARVPRDSERERRWWSIIPFIN
ncbi:MAG TPA: peptidylprolyl isomerase [Terricaulis sp.]|nr:peptidylprolyl isomerase [Terricaulis sp.]